MIVSHQDDRNMKNHRYQISVRWIGNTGTGTSGYTAYRRDHVISAGDKPEIPGSSDLHFRGDANRYNPEEMLIASLSSCHMLWYLHLCAEAGVVVTHYQDQAEGTMVEKKGGGGRFEEVVLKPVVAVQEAFMIDMAERLHQRAAELCFIASSVNFPVHHQPTVRWDQQR